MTSFSPVIARDARVVVRCFPQFPPMKCGGTVGDRPYAAPSEFLVLTRRATEKWSPSRPHANANSVFRDVLVRYLRSGSLGE